MFPGFELFGKTIASYVVCALVGIFVGGIYACKKAKQQGLNDNDMIMVLLSAAVGVWLGSHLLYGLTNIRYIPLLVQNLHQLDSVRSFLKGIIFIFGGSVFYGGLFGGMLGAFLFAKKQRYPLPVYSDILSATIPLVHSFARIGCFLGGCCYGIECKFGVTFTHSFAPMANGVSRFPVQLAEAAYELFLFFVLSHMLKTGRGKGRLLSLYLGCYATGRFFLEFLRGDEYRGIYFSLSTSQWISLLVLGTVLSIEGYRRFRRLQN